MTERTLTEDAMTVVALAGTALAYATTLDDEVERWVRALHGYGEAGIALRAAGVEADSRTVRDGAPAGSPADAEARVAAVLACADEFAVQRGADLVSTLDLLPAVMRVYGDTFDRALTERQTDRMTVIEELDVVSRADSGVR